MNYFVLLQIKLIAMAFCIIVSNTMQLDWHMNELRQQLELYFIHQHAHGFSLQEINEEIRMSLRKNHWLIIQIFFPGNLVTTHITFMIFRMFTSLHT